MWSSFTKDFAEFTQNLRADTNELVNVVSRLTAQVTESHSLGVYAGDEELPSLWSEDNEGMLSGQQVPWPAVSEQKLLLLQQDSETYLCPLTAAEQRALEQWPSALVELYASDEVVRRLLHCSDAVYGKYVQLVMGGEEGSSDADMDIATEDAAALPPPVQLPLAPLPIVDGSPSDATPQRSGLTDAVGDAIPDNGAPLVAHDVFVQRYFLRLRELRRREALLAAKRREAEALTVATASNVADLSRGEAPPPAGSRGGPSSAVLSGWASDDSDADDEAGERQRPTIAAEVGTEALSRGLTRQRQEAIKAMITQDGTGDELGLADDLSDWSELDQGAAVIGLARQAADEPAVVKQLRAQVAQLQRALAAVQEEKAQLQRVYEAATGVSWRYAVDTADALSAAAGEPPATGDTIHPVVPAPQPAGAVPAPREAEAGHFSSDRAADLPSTPQSIDAEGSATEAAVAGSPVARSHTAGHKDDEGSSHNDDDWAALA